MINHLISTPKNGYEETKKGRESGNLPSDNMTLSQIDFLRLIAHIW